MKMDVRLLHGAAAERRLADRRFLDAWQELAAEDGKQHWFQQPFFCTAWYAAYAHRWAPLLVVLEGDGGLRGLMPLAVGDGGVVHAGAHQCEYQGWLATADVDAEFGREAVARVLAAGHTERWEWKNVAPGTPVAWLQEPGSAAHLSEPFASPLLDVHDQEFLTERMRGRLRSYRNRLSRRGLRYERIGEFAAARELLHRLASWCDLRQVAAHGSLPFAGDQAKMPLHERLLERPEEVWLSALFLDDAPIAAHLGFMHRGELAMGIQGYDPREGRASPGALMLFDIAADLASAGAHTLDLTPGGDAWKERYASRHRQVHRMVLHRSRAAAMAESARRALRTSARLAIAGIGGDRLHCAVTAEPASPLAAVDTIAGDRLPVAGPAAATDAAAIERLLLEHAATIGVDRAGNWMQEAMRRLASGWRPAALRDQSGAPVLLWASPAGATVDLSDPGAPRIAEPESAAAVLVVRADGAGSLPPANHVGEAMAAALGAWNESPAQLFLLTDAGSPGVRAWIRTTEPERWRRAG